MQLMTIDDAKSYLQSVFLSIQDIKEQDETKSGLPFPFLSMFFDDRTLFSCPLICERDKWAEVALEFLYTTMKEAENNKKNIVSISVVSENYVAKANSEHDFAKVMHWKNQFGSIKDCPYATIEESLSLYYVNLQEKNEESNFISIDMKSYDGDIDNISYNSSECYGGFLQEILQTVKSQYQTLNA